MQTRSLEAEIFFSLPSHLWVMLVAGVIAFVGLRMAEQSGNRESLLRIATYAALLALAIIPNGVYLLFTPTPDMPELLVQGGSLPNYYGLFALDAFYVFAGWMLSWVIRSRLD